MLLPDGTNVNHALIKDGWCWWYRKYAPGDAVLEELQIVDAELCPDKKMGNESRFCDVHGCGGIDKPFQSHPVI